ncbi:MAG TPA: hypothetical protein VJW51_07330 [Candidatus Acidoferrales bacterium]|nr:hypothetical protein [Candidatus Acidoferrales bacterium]
MHFQLPPPLSALLFLAASGVVAGLAGVAVIAVVVGNSRIAGAVEAASHWLFAGRGLAAKAAAAAGAVCACYLLLLFGFSLASHDRTLAAGAEKYFCEMDCHLAYSVAGAEYVSSVGASPSVAPAQGVFLRVTVRTRFDETTISPQRPRDAPLIRMPRTLFIVDEQGRLYPVSAGGEQALVSSGQAGTPMWHPLVPGQSYTTEFVFNLPGKIRSPRLLVTSPAVPEWMGRLMIGGEDSFLHAKVYLPIAARGGDAAATGD